jgi:PTS system ascorbate-specific IIC component
VSNIISFILFQVLDKAPVFLGLVVLVGLLLQKKSANEVIDGVVKTVVGLLILTAGAGILMSAIGPIMTKLNAVLGVKGVVPANEAAFGVAMADALGLANSITSTFLLGFIIHLIIVALIPFKSCKNVYLTVHIMLFLSAFLNVALPGILGLSGVPLIIVNAVMCALYWTFSPAITRVLGKTFLGDDFTLGHHQQVGAALTRWIAPLFGRPEQDAENIKLPGFLSMFRDSTISLSILMPLIFIGIGLSVGSADISALSGKTNWIIWLILEGLRFTAGVVILLQGVRMFIASIVPAFKGISDRLLPNTTPALDSPTIYPYSPTGAMLGFIASVVGAIIVMIGCIVLGSPTIVFPSPIIMFFDGCAMGVFGNKFGGYKGAIGAGLVTSIISHSGVILLYPLVGPVYGSGLMFSNIDFTLLWLPLLYLLKLLGLALGLVV